MMNIPEEELLRETVQEIIEHLLKHSEKSEEVMMVEEITQRYAAKRLQSGEPFQKSTQVCEHFRLRLREAKRESFHTVFLDNKHRVTKVKMITLGTLNQSLVHPREVFAPAIELRAAAIIPIHNHPSGDCISAQLAVCCSCGDFLSLTACSQDLGGVKRRKFNKPKVEKGC